MRVSYHLGAYCTDEDRLVRCLLKNRSALADARIAVPPPTRYRRLLRDTVLRLKGEVASYEQETLVLDKILGDDQADRMVLSWEGFISHTPWVVRRRLYPFAGQRMRSFTRIFPDLEAEFHLAIRNPATFLPALQKVINAHDQADVLDGADPLELRWSEVVSHILSFNPEVPITVWCDEETPLIWPEVLQAVSGHGPDLALAETDELLALIMNDIGLVRLKTYMAEHPPQNVALRRRVVSAFLEKFARQEAVNYEIEKDGWNDELVERLTDRYHGDIERIRSMPGVTFLSS
jgi:hypothetical protein